jgi:biotin carboxyl carrier protein
MRLRLSLRGQVEELTIRRQADRVVVQWPGGRQLEYEILSVSPGRLALSRDGRALMAEFEITRQELHLHLAGRSLHVHRVDAAEAEAEASGGEPILRAPMPGRVLEILVQSGDRVRKGTALLRVEAMKMQVDLAAPLDGTVAAIHVRAGELVLPEANLITIEPQLP